MSGQVAPSPAEPSTDDVRYMALALGLGRRGLGHTWPNPAVGCVIVLLPKLGTEIFPDSNVPLVRLRLRAPTGTRIEADIWFRCHGTTPATGYLSDELAAGAHPGRIPRGHPNRARTPERLVCNTSGIVWCLGRAEPVLAGVSWLF